jgi:hypothetical protein
MHSEMRGFRHPEYISSAVAQMLLLMQSNRHFKQGLQQEQIAGAFQHIQKQLIREHIKGN